MGFLDIINQREAEDDLEGKAANALYRRQIEEQALANVIWQQAEERARAAAAPMPAPTLVQNNVDPRFATQPHELCDIIVDSGQIVGSRPTGGMAPVPAGPTAMMAQPRIDAFAGMLDPVAMGMAPSPSVVQNNVQVPRPSVGGAQSAPPPMPSLLERGTIDPYQGMFDQVPMQNTTPTQGVEPKGPALPPAAPIAPPAPQAPPAPEATMGGYSAPQRAPQLGPPATAEEFQARVSGWDRLKQNLARPEILGPLQTFLTAVSAPLGPGESMGSRMGRASMLAQVHQKMLQENEKNAEYNLRMQRAELDAKEGGVAKTRLDNEGKRISNVKNEASMPWELAASAQGVRKLELENEGLPQKQKDDSAYKQEMTKYYSRIPQQSGNGGASLKPVEDLSVDEAVAELNSYTDAFRGSGADKVEGANQIEWIAQNYKGDALIRFNKLARKLAQHGITVKWTANGEVLYSRDGPGAGTSTAPAPAASGKGALGSAENPFPYRPPAIRPGAVDEIPR